MLSVASRYAIAVTHLLAANTFVALAADAPSSAASLAETRAIAYLEREVPCWSRENHCYSCHNNGDGARALVSALTAGRTISKAALSDTLSWLGKPDDWNDNKGDPAFSDETLADLQFAVLCLQVESSKLRALSNAAHLATAKILSRQSSDGSWTLAGTGSLAGPTTWGTPLATLLAWRALRTARSPQAAAGVAKAERWLDELAPSTINSASVITLYQSDSGKAHRFGDAAYSLLRKSQASDGGWGPYADAAPQAFDTALALLAVAKVDRADADSLRARARSFLAATQQPDGSWPATTRPAGGESYAQQVSTTAWAIMALLETSSGPKR